METQANADTKIGSAAEHRHSNNSVLPKENGANILVLCLHQDHENRLYLKRCGVVYDISKRQSFSLTAKVCDYITRLFGNNTASRFYGRPLRKTLREELGSDYVHELAVSLNSKEEIRLAGIKLSAAH